MSEELEPVVDLMEALKASLAAAGKPANVLNEMVEESKKPLVLDEGQIKALTDLVDQKIKLEERIEKGNALLDKLSDELLTLTTKTIPDLCYQLNVGYLELTDGSSLEIDTQYFASIKEENKAAAFAWLRKNLHGDLIKHLFTVEFGKGDDKLAKRFTDSIKRRATPLKWSDKETVHPMTLKGFVREQREAGVDVPMDLLGAHVLRVAKIKPAAKAKIRTGETK